ncbi:MAG: deaminase [Spirochaetota bacterium]
MKKMLIAYVPVLHDGYLRLFSKYAANIDVLLIFSRALVKEFTYLEEEIRAVDPAVMVEVVKSLNLFRNVLVLEAHMINYICRDYEIVAVDDSISRRLIEKYIPENKVVELISAFLRWDETNIMVSKPAGYQRESCDVFDREMIALANHEAQKSSDWWRRVGAVAVKDGKVLFSAYNRHLPSEHTPYVFGDPRDFIKAGEQSEIATSLHAEQAIIIEAAKSGVSVKGADIYVSVFPCPMCAKPVALAGFRRCFFASGHASLNGVEIMKSEGVEIVLVR